jgi:hypothetical protein
MNSFIQALSKSQYQITFGWNPEYPPNLGTVAYYNVYVGQTQVASSMTKIASNIGPSPDNQNPGNIGKIIYQAQLATVQSVLILPSTSDFTNLLLYWAITWVNQAGSESSIGNSTIVMVPPVGIIGLTMRDDPSIRRQGFVFSDELQMWIKTAGSELGAVITDACDLYKTNTVTQYTRDNTGNILVEKIYWADRTTSGSPAKLINYTYTDISGTSYVSQIVISDSTV